MTATTPHGPKVVVRTGLSRDLPVEGELFRIEGAKSRIFGRTAYVSGEITACWLDLERLQLEPLEVFHREDDTSIVFNPADNQGIRFLRDDPVAEQPWQASEWGGRPS